MGVFDMHGTATPYLTRREREIALAVSTGRSNAEIARDLNLREQTIKNGVSRILRKLQRENRVQLAMWVAAELKPTEAPTTKM
jgi:DNA-binding NarL/FixJ family response regulator